MAAFACLPLACAKKEVPMECLAIPEASQVARVKVALLRANGTTQSDYQIDTRPRVAELIAALKNHPGRDCRTAEKDRPQEMSVSFESDDFQNHEAVPLILWIGPGWIGGVDGKKDARGWRIGRWRPMDAAERASLLPLLRPEDVPYQVPHRPHEPKGKSPSS
jgi:hypothetical protein